MPSSWTGCSPKNSEPRLPGTLPCAPTWLASRSTKSLDVFDFSYQPSLKKTTAQPRQSSGREQAEGKTQDLYRAQTSDH